MSLGLSNYVLTTEYFANEKLGTRPLDETKEHSPNRGLAYTEEWIPSTLAMNSNKKRKLAWFLGLVACGIPFQFWVIDGQSEINTLLLSVWILIGSCLTYLCLSVLQRAHSMNLMLTPLCLYLLFAFVYKAVAVFGPSTPGVQFAFGDFDKFSSEVMSNAIEGAAVGATAAWIAILFFSVTYNAPNQTYGTTRLFRTLFYAVFLVSCVLKWIVHYKLGWGIPGAEPTGTIPLITGLTVIYVRLGMLLLVTASVYYAMDAKSGSLEKAMAMLSAGTYVAIDLGVGSKYSLIYVVVIFALVIAHKIHVSGMPRPAVIVAFAIALAGTSVVYKYVNYYRFARLRDNDMSIVEMMQFAQSHADDGGNTWQEITQRINGFEKIPTAVANARFAKPGLIDILVPAQFAEDYTEAASGVSGSSNAVGCTQIGFFLLLCKGNLPLLFIAMFTFQFFSIRTVTFCIFRFLQRDDTRMIAMIVMAIFLVNLHFGSGTLLVYLKELIVIFITAFALESILSTKKRTAPSDSSSISATQD